MDYESIHGQDISSFDFTSTHRLPTVSAAQALEDISNDQCQSISTGIGALDQALDEVRDNRGSKTSLKAGALQRGHVVEVWGPPGSGKTVFGMQLAANRLKQGGQIVWVDAFHPICGQRLQHILTSGSPLPAPDTPSHPIAEQREKLLHYTTPTLAHFIALLCKPTSASLPVDTSLIVIDSLSSLINHSFPKNLEGRKTAKGQGPSPRRLPVLQFIISALQKLAATRDVLIVILSQCATKMQMDHGATLIPAVNASAWEQGITTRLVLFRDWMMKNVAAENVYLVGIQKHNGRTSPGGMMHAFPFDIGSHGLIGIELDGTQPSLTITSTPHKKRRKPDSADLEIPDSEGEDFGWEEEDETEMPTMPPQWQGSEDILLGQHDNDGERIDEKSESYSMQGDDSPPALHPRDTPQDDRPED